MESSLNSCCHTPTKKPDYLLRIGASLVAALYVLYVLIHGNIISLPTWVTHASHATFELTNQMAWGVLLGMVTVGFLALVPREFVIAFLGHHRGLRGIVRATLMGLLLDLCSHGIVLVGMKLYERGASLGQVMAFLIASPWNSFSLTLILIALLGLKWTLVFILLSALIGIITGLIVEWLVTKKHLPPNPHTNELPEDFHFMRSAKEKLSAVRFDRNFFKKVAHHSIADSSMVLRWVFVGILLASFIRSAVPTDYFQDFFGPTVLGLLATLFFATIIEVCSEGSAPIASELFTRAHAIGNSFAFLMAGVSTDYTEIMSIKSTTGSWKIALALPWITLPQILFIAWVMNHLTR